MVTAKSFTEDSMPVGVDPVLAVEPMPVEPMPVEPMSVEPMPVAANRPLVLVVDDSSDMRGLIEDVLSEQGHEVLTAASGGRALSLMAERLPDLVITDLMMPGMSGFTLRGEMLRRPELAAVPVVVLSAYWQRPGETLDVVEVLHKPINVDRLVEVVAGVTRPEA